MASGIEVQDEKSYLKKLAGSEEKPEMKYGLRMMAPRTVEKTGAPVAEAKEVQQAIETLEKARDLVDSRWLRGGWSADEQEYEERESKKFEETHYCTMGAILHVRGNKDDSVGEDEAKEMFTEDPLLFRSMAYAFRNHMDEPDAYKDLDLKNLDEDEKPEEPVKPEPPEEPVYPTRPPEADTDDEVDLKHKIDVENYNDFMAEYKDEMKTYERDLKDYEEDVRTYPQRLEEWKKYQEDEARKENVDNLVDTIAGFNDQEKTFRGMIHDKFTSAITFLKRML